MKNLVSLFLILFSFNSYAGEGCPGMVSLSVSCNGIYVNDSVVYVGTGSFLHFSANSHSNSGCNDLGSFIIYRNGTKIYEMPSSNTGCCHDVSLPADTGFYQVSSWGSGPGNKAFRVKLKEANSLDEYSKVQIQAFPIPVNDQIKVISEEEIRECYLTDSQGKVLLNRAYSSKELVLDFSGLSKGVYFIRIRSESGWSEKKVLK